MESLKLIIENDLVEVPSKAAKMSTTLKNMIEDLGDSANEGIPVHNVTKAVFAKVMEYCKQHMDEPVKDEKKTVFRKTEDPWDTTWISALEQRMLFDVMLASNYLEIKGLLDLCCTCVAKDFKTLYVFLKHVFSLIFTPEPPKNCERSTTSPPSFLLLKKRRKSRLK